LPSSLKSLIARRGVEQSNVLFGGQIGPATKALSTRINTIGVGDRAPHFSLPTAAGQMWSLGERLQGEYDSLVVVFYRGRVNPTYRGDGKVGANDPERTSQTARLQHFLR